MSSSPLSATAERRMSAASTSPTALKSGHVGQAAQAQLQVLVDSGAELHGIQASGRQQSPLSPSSQPHQQDMVQLSPVSIASQASLALPPSPGQHPALLGQQQQQQQQQQQRKRDKIASTLKSSVVYGGSALLSGVTAITPHLAGAVDIMVVQQPDGRLLSTPFYVRFGKYTPLRNKERDVKMYVNGELASFGMHLGSQGHAYFLEPLEPTLDAPSGLDDREAALDAALVAEDDEVEVEAMLAGMMSPASGYSSGGEEGNGSPSRLIPETAIGALTTLQQLQGARLQDSHASLSSMVSLRSMGSNGSSSGTAAAPPPPSAGAMAAAAAMPASAAAIAVAVTNAAAARPGAEGDAVPLEAQQRQSTASPVPGSSVARVAVRRRETSDSAGDTAVSGSLSSAAAAQSQAESAGHAEALLLVETAAASLAAQGGQLGPAGAPAAPTPGQVAEAAAVLLVAAAEEAAEVLEGSMLNRDAPAGFEQAAAGVQQGLETPGELGQGHQGQLQVQLGIAEQGGIRTVLPEQGGQHGVSASGAVDVFQDLLQPREVGLAATLASRAGTVGEASAAIPSQVGSSPPELQSGDVQGLGPQVVAAQAAGMNILGSEGHLQQIHESQAVSVVQHGSEVQAQQPGHRKTSSFSFAAPSAQLEGSSTAGASLPGPRVQSGPVLLQAPLASQEPAPRGVTGGQSLGQGQGQGQAQGQAQALGQVVGLPREQAGGQGQGEVRQQGCVSQAAAEDPSQLPAVGSSASPAAAGASQHADTLPSAPVGNNPSAVHGSSRSAAVGSRSSALLGSSPSSDGGYLTDTEACRPGAAAAGGHSRSSSRSPPPHARTAPSLSLTPSEQAAGEAGLLASPRSAPALGALPDASQHVSPAATHSSSAQGHVDAASPGAQGLLAAAAGAGSSASPARSTGQGWLAAGTAGAAAQSASPASRPPRHYVMHQAEQQRHEGAGVSSHQSPAAAAASLLRGLELSLCGGQLSMHTTNGEAQQLFNHYRVHADSFASGGRDIMAAPELMVRVDGTIYPFSDAAPLLMGAAVFGCRWDHLLPAPATNWGTPFGGAPGGPGSDLGPDSARFVSKKTSTSWLLWPFSAWSTTAANAPLAGQHIHARSGSLSGGAPGPSVPLSAAAAAALGGSPGRLLVSPSAPVLAPGGGGSGSFGGGSPAFVPPHSVSMPPSSGVAGMYGGTGELLRYSRSASLVLAEGPKMRKVLTPSCEQLASLKLKLGRNRVTYRVGAATEVSAYMYLVRWDTKIVISDVDGTITRSDVLGHLLPAIGLDWSHPGISQLLTNVATNGYQVMYLSSRSIGQANITRDYLNTIVQGEHRMPAGPVIISPDGVLPSLYREMILRRPHEFKIATLSEIRALFPPEWNPFYAGFGNRDTDEISYKAVGVPTGRIFIINPKGELRMASTTIRSSTLSTLRAINEIVSTIFPPLLGPGAATWGVTGGGAAASDGEAEAGTTTKAGVTAVDETYNDLQYWGTRASTLDGDADLMARYLSPATAVTKAAGTGAGAGAPGAGPGVGSAGTLARMSAPAAVAGGKVEGVEAGTGAPGGGVGAAVPSSAAPGTASTAKRRAWGYARGTSGSARGAAVAAAAAAALSESGAGAGALSPMQAGAEGGADGSAVQGRSSDNEDNESWEDAEEGELDEEGASFLSSYNPFAA